MVSFKPIAFGVAAALFAASAPAMADAKTKAVHFSDLDLSSERGQQRLATRIKSAVKSVCYSPRAITTAEKRDQDRCHRDAMDGALPKAERTIARYKASGRVAANEPIAIVGN